MIFTDKRMIYTDKRKRFTLIRERDCPQITQIYTDYLFYDDNPECQCSDFSGLFVINYMCQLLIINAYTNVFNCQNIYK